MTFKFLKLTMPVALVVALTASVACIEKPAQAQSIYGPGGLFINPTADLPAKGKITPAILGLPEKFGDKPGRLTWSSYNIDYGATDRLELGATYLKINPGGGKFDNGSAGLYAKYLVKKATPGCPLAVAVGASYLGGGDADTHTTFAALRWTPTKPDDKHPVHLHLGALYVAEMDGVERHKARPYYGIDYQAAPNLSLFAEERAGFPTKSGADGSDGAQVAHSIGFAWHPVKNYLLVLAYGTNGWNKAPSQLGVGIGYSIGGGR